MIKAVIAIYVVVIALTAVGWGMAQQEVSLPITIGIAVGVVSLGIVIAGVVMGYSSNDSA